MRYLFAVGPDRRQRPADYLCVSWGPDLFMARGPDVPSAVRAVLQKVPAEQLVCDPALAGEAQSLGLEVGNLPLTPRGVKAVLELQLTHKRTPRGMTLEHSAQALHDAERFVAALDGKLSNEGRLDRH